MGTYRSIGYCTGPYQTMGDHMGPYGTIRNHRVPYGTIIRDYSQLFKAVSNFFVTHSLTGAIHSCR